MKRPPARLARLALVLACLWPAAAPAQPAGPRRTVDGGTIEGRVLDGGVDAFLGVPFAQPPVRGLRWKPPQPVAAWQGVHHADRFAPECLQPLRGSQQNHYFGEEATSEDCLYLNVWAPRAAYRAPVVVWIYGGGFNVGSASMANYSGEPLARDGVVRVNLAYRVGALGFLAHPALSRESGYGGSGDYGLMDLVAGLQWVRRNIARFGGDPRNVTIVGQSAGSMAVSLLQVSPLARGLFDKAVAMSGSAFGGMIGPTPLAQAERQGLALQEAVGARSLAELRAVPGDRLVAAATPRDAIVLDGHMLTGSAQTVFARGGAAAVPVMLGYTRDESFRPLTATDPAALAAQVRERFGAQGLAILSAYSSGNVRRDAADIARDASVGAQMAGWAAAQAAAGGPPVYAYLFNRRQPYATGIAFSDHDPAAVGAYHSGDIPYWLRTRPAFNLFRQTRSWTAGDAALETEMASALLSFARTGVPQSPVIGRWPRYDPAAPRLVSLDTASRIVPWPHHADMPLFGGAPPVPRPAADPARPRD